MTSPAVIHLRVHAVGKVFVGLAQALKAAPRYTEQLAPEEIEDQFDRFKIWAGNIAAHRTGRTSLEYRLRDASHLKDEANSLLSALEQSLTRALAILRGEVVPWDALPDSDSDDADSDTSSKADSDTELQQLLTSVKSSVTCLFRLSISIKDPAPDDKLHGTITVDKSYFEEHDIMHARAKYPRCPEYLTERLGRAISGRRQYFSYREQHHQRLIKKVELVGLEQPRSEHTSNSTEATPLPLCIDPPTGTSEEDDGASETSYADSLNATIRVPPLPKGAQENQPFECPLCYNIVSIRTESVWKQHVFRDLHPYSCTFEQCPMEDHLFGSRHAWYRHELEAHRSMWQCIPGCDTSFAYVNEYDDHVSTAHPELASPSVLAALKMTAQKIASTTARDNCPCCNAQMTIRALERHIGRHQEELALFALPSNLGETDEDIEDKDEGSNYANSCAEDWTVEGTSDVSDEDAVQGNVHVRPGEHDIPIICLNCGNEWLGAPHTMCPICGPTATETVQEAILPWPWENRPPITAGESQHSRLGQISGDNNFNESTSHANEKGDTFLESPIAPSSLGEVKGAAIALFNFERENDNELKLVEGQHLWIAYRHGQGWLVAQDLKTGESGLVPEEYVRLIGDVPGGIESVVLNENDNSGIERGASAESYPLPTTSAEKKDHSTVPLSSGLRNETDLLIRAHMSDLNLGSRSLVKTLGHELRDEESTKLHLSSAPGRENISRLEEREEDIAKSSEEMREGDERSQEQERISPGESGTEPASKLTDDAYMQGDALTYQKASGVDPGSVRQGKTPANPVVPEKGPEKPFDRSYEKSHRRTTVWYCGNCGDGPNNINLAIGCAFCGHLRDGCCTISKAIF